MRGLRIRNVALALAGVSLAGLATPLVAQAQTRSDARRNFDIPAQGMVSALEAFGRQSGRDILFDRGQVAELRSVAVRGMLEPQHALRQLLGNSNLSISVPNTATFVVGRSAGEGGAGGAAADNESAEQIVVTGTRIRGGILAAPMITVTAEDARRAGQADLGEVLRSIPQNFGGGSNPGIGFGAESFGSEPSPGQSAPNLRGLGPSATLTLLNGRRMPYTLTGQGVDISAIPLAAVERVEIVPDGSSALYGSDAVAGVINVLLKRNYDGLTVTGRTGASTDGGNENLGLEATGGIRWESGGLLAAGGYSRASMIRARDRDYVTNFDGSGTLYPRLSTWSGVVSANQQITADVTARIDGLYTDRSSQREVPLTTLGDYRVSGSRRDAGSESYFLSPTLEVQLPEDWTGSLNYSYGRDLTASDASFYSGEVLSARQIVRIRNSTNVVELNAEGPIFRLPAGNARFAFGGGYRRIDFLRRSGATLDSLAGFEASRNSHYGYGEVFAPIIAPDQDVPGVHRFSLTGAVRYEDYSDFGGVTTPKLAIIYAPTADLRFSATWGRSFKTPTLQQQNLLPTLLLVPTSLLGGTGYPATATAVFISGGNPNLGPERSTNWSATFTATPRAIPGLTVEMSYFNIDYRDRITNPISSLLTALANPIYAPFLTPLPSAAEVADAVALATAPSYFVNFTGRPFDPSEVEVLVDGRATNVARQQVEGVDLAAAYTMPTGDEGQVTASLNAAYLESTNVLLVGAAETALAGTVFNPPHWRARGGLSWTNERWAISSFVNYVGPLDDVRVSTTYELDGQATFDLSIGYRFDGGALDGFSVQVAALNLFNAKPQPLVTMSAGEVPYDSTNYSPVGRYLSLSITRTF